MCVSGIWRTGPGDTVEVDEPIAQIETDKVIPHPTSLAAVVEGDWFVLLTCNTYFPIR